MRGTGSRCTPTIAPAHGRRTVPCPPGRKPVKNTALGVYRWLRLPPRRVDAAKSLQTKNEYNGSRSSESSLMKGDHDENHD